MTLRVLAVTNMYPTPVDPTYGSFVATQMRSVASAGVHVEVDFVNGRQGDWEYARAIGRLRRRARSREFDLLHAHYGLTAFVAAFQSLPLVASFCGDDLLGTPDGRGGMTLKSRLARQLSYIASRRADAIICKSAELRSALPRSLDRERAYVIGNGVDTDLFCPGDVRAARQRLGMSADQRLVLFPHSRRQAAVKRFDLAEAAMADGVMAGFEAKLWVVNDVLPEMMPDYYRAADCLLLTSDHEGSPNVVKEALACDLPVVSVHVGDVPRWLGLAPGCRLVERDSRSIAQGLRDVLLERRRIDGGAVRAQIMLSAVASQVLTVYNEVLERTKSRSK